MPTATSHGPFRRRGFITAAAVLLVIVLLSVIAIVAGLFHGGEDNITAIEPTAAPSAPAAAAQSDSDPSVCGMKGYETTSSLTAAPDNVWELVGTVAVPSDPAVGPGVIEDDGFRHCYSHTAQGALFAAANAYALGSDATYRTRVFELAVPGVGRDMLRARADAGDESTSSARLQYVGFAVLAYDGDTATIDLAVNRSNDGQLISLPTKLEWAEGDWKLAVTTDGRSPLTPAALDSLGGYIPWSGA